MNEKNFSWNENMLTMNGNFSFLNAGVEASSAEWKMGVLYPQKIIKNSSVECELLKGTMPRC